MIYILIGPLRHSSSFDTIKREIILFIKTQFTIRS